MTNEPRHLMGAFSAAQAGLAPITAQDARKTAAPDAAKFLFDRLAAVAGLVLFGPLMLLVAGLIWAQRDGPVIFSHERVGRGGRRFRCHKFRTMVPSSGDRFDRILEIDPIARADWRQHRKIHRDPRVTRLGDILRKTSLDELPQFWNVLVGDMSMVGPRPVTSEELVEYGRHVDHYLAVRPGLTGTWQVSGRSDASYEERVRMDVDYVTTRNFAMDLHIVLRTVRVVLDRSGAY